MSTTSQLTAAILIIGNEILSGRTQEANIVVIARKMGEMGIKLREVRVVPDEEAAIIEALDALRQANAYLFTTGGIGPTHDDITMAAVAKAFGVPLVESAEALASLEAYYTPGNMNPARRRMALVPQGAVLVQNPATAAPGIRIDNVFVLAGVPEVMQLMLEAAVTTLPHGPQQYAMTVRCTLPESLLADDLAVIAQNHPEVDIGSYPTFRGGRIGLALVVRGLDQSMVNGAAQKIAATVTALGGAPEIIEGF